MTSTKTTPPADTDETATRVGPMHESFAAYLNEKFNAGITPRQIFLVTSQRKAFRATDTYRVDVAKAKEAAKAAAAAEKKAAREKAAAERKAAAPAAPVEKKAPAAKSATKKPTAQKS